MSTVCGFLCRKVVPPKERAYFKNLEEKVLSSVLSTLSSEHHLSKEELDDFLKKQVLCRGRCQTSIKKLRKLQEEMKELEERIKLSYNEATLELPDDEHSSLVNTPVRDRVKGRRRLQLDTPIKQEIKRTVIGESPVVSVVVKKRGKHRVHRLTRSMKSLGRSVGRRNVQSIVNQVMKNKAIRRKIIPKIGRILHNELRETCLSHNNSSFKDKGTSSLENFNWKDLTNDLKRTAPTLVSLLEICLKKRSGANSHTDRYMVVSCSILLRAYSERSNLVQRLFSVLLYASHSPKQLFGRLQKVGICVSHKSTIRLIEKLGQGYDEPVKKWRDMVAEKFLFARSCGEQSENIPEEITSTNIVCIDEGLDTEEVQYNNSPNDVIDSSSEASSASISTPTFSPISSSDHEFRSPEQNDQDRTNDKDKTYDKDNSILAISVSSFKLVGDNVDKSSKPRHETSESHTQSLHYFHSYAVKDRCDIEGLDDSVSLPVVEDVIVTKLLPTNEDLKCLQKNINILIARTVMKHCTFFREKIQSLEHHIPHPFSKQMSLKSDVFPLGVLLKNEVKQEDMVSIMSHLQQYVPVKSEEIQIRETINDGNNECKEDSMFLDKFHYLLFGGDQLTVERAHGSKKCRSNEIRGLDRLEGLIPVVEDWHAKVIFLKAIWKILYKTSSGSNSATLFQLRNMIQRKTVTAKIKSDPTACEEFFLVVVEAHIIAAVMLEFGLDSIDGTPNSEVFINKDFSEGTPSQRKTIFMVGISKVGEKYLFPFGKAAKKESDHVHAYAKELLSLGLLYMEFCDGIREGDGLRILRCWRYMMMLFKAKDKRKYAIQASTLLFQFHFLFSDRMAHQLLWSRTVNTHGRQGRNVPMDLHIEHLNRELKEAMTHLSSNVSEQSIHRTGKCLGKLIDIKANYDRCTGIPSPYGYHSPHLVAKDLHRVVEELRSSGVFNEVKGRQHSEFPKFLGNTLSTIKQGDIKPWLTDQLKKLIIYS